MYKYKTILIPEELHTLIKVHCATHGETVAGKVAEILTEVFDIENKLAKNLIERDIPVEKKTLKESKEEIRGVEKNADTLTKERGKINSEDYI